MGTCYSKKRETFRKNSSHLISSDVLHRERQQRMDLNEYFDRFDKDKDGQLDREDVFRMMEEIQMGKRGGQNIEAMVDSFMDQMDANHNGKITKEEFRKFYRL